LVATCLEFGAQSGVILDDAVVNHGDAACAIEMGMRVGPGDTAVRRPARVPDCEAGGRVRWRVTVETPNVLVKE
jgi:hypothetical protein